MIAKLIDVYLQQYVDLDYQVQVVDFVNGNAAHF